MKTYIYFDRITIDRHFDILEDNIDINILFVFFKILIV